MKKNNQVLEYTRPLNIVKGQFQVIKQAIHDTQESVNLLRLVFKDTEAGKKLSFIKYNLDFSMKYIEFLEKAKK